ncbi:MAG: twitching motility protein [Desulfofustis sp.]|nr:twitching motility protein [Desulfofustis sp.]MBT8354241.1 twitching motility protein [Desulfofustis sp.]NNF46088.1 twitching motility protein [Desulfofustis sp.]NNK58210.1 twitching motility protein [Desulfofustis sp.]
MELKKNQSALILEINDDGEIFVEVASSDHEGLTALLCQAIAVKLLGDEKFSSELMDMIEDDQ